MTDPNSFTTRYKYDNSNQIIQITYPATGQASSGPGSIKYNYDYDGGALYTVQMFDESGNVVRQIADTPGKEGEIQGVVGAVPSVYAAYDPQYRVKRLRDGTGNSTTYSRDAVGNLSKVTYANTLFETARFDKDYNLQSFTNARKQQSSLNLATADSAVTSVTFSDSPLATAYRYDGYGRLIAENNGSVAQTYTYDDADNVLTKTVVFQTFDFVSDELDYSYYSNGQVASLYSNIGTINYVYDDAGNTQEVDYPWSDLNNIPQKVTYIYDNDDRVLTQTTSVATTTYAYNGRGQTTSIDNEATTPVSTEKYGYGYTNVAGVELVGAGTKLIAKYDTFQIRRRGQLAKIQCHISALVSTAAQRRDRILWPEFCFGFQRNLHLHLRRARPPYERDGGATRHPTDEKPETAALLQNGVQFQLHDEWRR